MSDEVDGEAMASDAAAVPGVGEQLRAAREAKGLTLAQVAAETRIGLGSLTRIEAGEFEKLPGRIYAVGFAKTYAKLVGLDQNDVADMVRFELGDDPEVRGHGSDFSPGDPARAPSRLLVWASVAALAVLITGLYFAARVLMDPAAQLPSLIDQEEAEQAEAAAAQAAQRAASAQPIDARGAVVLTAEETLWLRISDAAGQRLMEGELAAGQSYTIPASANGPKVITARPDVLAITVGGRAVPKLSEVMRTVSDMPVDATSLLARHAPTAAATASAAPAPSPSASAPAPSPSASAVPSTPRPAVTVD